MVKRNKLGQFVKGHSGYQLGKKRPKKVREKIRQSLKGKIPWNKGKSYKRNDNPFGKEARNWKGGRIKAKNGYIYILQPTHPFCHKSGYIAEHRLVVEKKIGRHLKPKEQVHHINGIRDDNRPKNLILILPGRPHFKKITCPRCNFTFGIGH